MAHATYPHVPSAPGRLGRAVSSAVTPRLERVDRAVVASLARSSIPCQG
jgi:hypothetical protein